MWQGVKPTNDTWNRNFWFPLRSHASTFYNILMLRTLPIFAEQGSQLHMSITGYWHTTSQ